MNSKWSERCVGDVAVFENRRRIPLSSAQRAGRPGPYPYWGANGPFDTVDDFLFEGPRVLVAEDGNTVVGPDGRGTVHWADGRYWVNNHAHVLSARPEHDLRWLYYALSVAYLRDFVSGSAQPKLSMTSLRQVPLAVPPRGEQCAIGRFLGAIDGKIDSNRRVEALCGVMIWWFADEHFVRRSTDDWPRKSLADVASFVNGKNFTRGATGTGRPVLRIKELNSGLSGSTVWNEVAAGPDHVASHYDLLFAWSGTLGVHRWDGPEALVNQHIFKVVPTSYPIWWVECWLRRHLDRFKRIAKDKAVTMGHIRRGDLSEAEVLVPPGDSLARFDAVLAPVDQLRASAAREARALADVRDALLPKLVSGQIRVPADPDELVDSVRQAADLAGSTA